MKKSFLFLATLLVLPFVLHGQAGQVAGFWLTDDSETQIEILRKADNKYYGRIVWLKETLNDQGRPKVDDKNPDKAMHNRPIMGLEL